ncbi:InlB B-repeat-containing protein, partial [Candidatus Chordibacter forsetii]|uniref:InlB B-repeat-containing protein n=1 Tax=Candidatus Chordibacter forsetii TaxID=3381758 RepID=UPI00389A93D2
MGCSQTIVAAPQITIVWGTVTSSNSPDLLKDASGNRLSAGVRGNGDGDLVELGYFSTGSTSDPFSGQWIPLTLQTYVGDSSSGYGFDDGMFVFTTNFFKNSNEVIVFPTEPKQFSENLSFAITASNPPPGTPICIRFYDSPNKGGAQYNTVTGDNWVWPAFPSGSSIPSNLYLKIASGDTPNGSSWRYGSLFEDNAAENRFKTTKSPLYDINFEINPNGQGTGTISDEINGSYTWGQTITITASPDEHSYFLQWVGTGISDPWSAETSLVVTGDQVVYAQFEKAPYFLDLSSTGLGQVSGGGLFAHGDSLTISAFPDQGQSFSHWEWDNNGSIFSENTTVTFPLQGDTALVAIFIPNEYQVLVGSTTGGSYEIFDSNGSIPSSYKHGNTYTIRSFPDQHFGFLKWSGTSDVLAMLDNENFAETTFIPSGNMSLTANFTELQYQLNVQSTQGYVSLYPPSGS